MSGQVGGPAEGPDGASSPNIFVTNDDGVDSVGLHVLARAMTTLGSVVVGAPAGEWSGSSAALGALNVIRPEVTSRHIEGISTAYAIDGPPGLCTMLALLGAFGPVPDLVVAGINPGANVGRAIYHSGTVGAALTARGRGVSGVAVSQEVPAGAIEGQAPEEWLVDQRWDTAATVAVAVVSALLSGPRAAEPAVVNVNVPNVDVAGLAGWRHTEVAIVSPRAMASARLLPRQGHTDSFEVEMTWGEPLALPEGTDSDAVGRGFVSISWLSRISALNVGEDRRAAQVGQALDGLHDTRRSG